MESRVVISFRELANILNLKSNKIDELISHVKTKFDVDNDEFEIILPKIRSFFNNFNKKLLKCNNSIQYLFKDPWMRGKIDIVLKKKDNLKRKVGRPTKCFDECAARTKRRKVQEMCLSVPKEQIERAAIRSVKKPVARVVKKILHATVSEVNDYSYKATKEGIIPLTDTEAVSVLIELDLGKHQYINIRNLAKARNANIFPPYYRVQEAKKLCYPDQSSIEINENSASIKLQALLNQTSKRLLESLSVDELSKLPLELTMISKYGCDMVQLGRVNINNCTKMTRKTKQIHKCS